MPTAQQIGLAWERRLDGWHASYLERGLARVKRCHALAERQRGPVDFMGHIKGRGPIAFDAKASSNMDLPARRLPLHQAQDLEGFADLGWLTGLMVRSSLFGDYWVPWKGALARSYWAKRFTLDLSEAKRFGEDGWLGTV